MRTDELQKVYRRAAGMYDAATALLDKLQLNTLRRDLLSRAHGRVLEVAVGTGKNLRYYPEGCDVTGVDLSKEMLLKADMRARGFHGRYTSVQADAMKMQFDPGAFDTVVCTLAGCTFPDPVAVFREMSRVCAPDGRILFMEHTRAQGKLGGTFMDVITPISRRLLGCNASQNVMANVAAAGLDVVREMAAAGGVFVALETVPAAG